jgi:two-component system nitrogen regulation response regulator GlnG
VIKWALLKAQGPVLLADFLPASVRPGEHHDGAPPPPAATTDRGEPKLDWDAFIESRLLSNTEDLHAEALALMERTLLTRVLRHTEGNQVQAARILGITRGSLRTKIRALGLRIERSVWSQDDQAGS